MSTLAEKLSANTVASRARATQAALADTPEGAAALARDIAFFESFLQDVRQSVSTRINSGATIEMLAFIVGLPTCREWRSVSFDHVERQRVAANHHIFELLNRYPPAPYSRSEFKSTNFLVPRPLHGPWQAFHDWAISEGLSFRWEITVGDNTRPEELRLFVTG